MGICIRCFLVLTILLSLSQRAIAQSKTYNVRYTKIIKDGEVVSEGGTLGQAIIINEAGKKVTLLSSSVKTPDRIFRIIEVGHDKNDIAYRCKMPTDDGFATVFFFIDTFYKTIRFVALQDCINFNEDRDEIEYDDYMQYNYR